MDPLRSHESRGHPSQQNSQVWIVTKVCRQLEEVLGSQEVHRGSPHLDAYKPSVKTATLRRVFASTSSTPGNIQFFWKKSGPLGFPWMVPRLVSCWINVRLAGGRGWEVTKEKMLSPLCHSVSQAHSSRSAQQNLGAKERSDVRAIVTCHQGPAEGPWVSALWVGSWMFETGMTERP